MTGARELWDQFVGKLLSPQVSEEKLNDYLHQAQARLPTPVFWMLGKTQSGKSSIVRALTGNTKAEVGSGFRPCTRMSHLYDFPSSDDCLIRFLDTRGLGEAQYDPTEDFALFQNQTHLVMVVMKALDHAQQPVFDVLRQMQQTHPGWPVLVVQTTLHEGYHSPRDQHPQPYPFGQLPFPPQVPANLARSLLTQREALRNAGVHVTEFVAVDFTLPEDGYEPVQYGLEALWDAIERILPLGLRNMLAQVDELQQHLRSLHYKEAHPHIIAYAVAAGAAAGIPVPFVDIPLVMAVQTKMFHTLAAIFHQDMTSDRIKEILGLLGVGFLGRLSGREMLKAIPGIGTAVAALYAGATTYALGWTLCAYFARVNQGALPNQEEFRGIYEKHFQEGRDKLRAYLTRRPPQG